MRKSRFTIDPNMLDPEQEVIESSNRPGPMATAIRDAAEASKERFESAEDVRLTQLKLAVDMRKLRDADLDLRLVPLADIVVDHLQRDRAELDEGDLAELKASIAATGLSNPIRVDETSEGQLLLIQGKRRLQAFAALMAETSDDRYSKIPVLVSKQGDRETAYRRMVDENLIRADVSYAELAQLAINYGNEAGQHPADVVDRLMASAGKMKRSRVRGFVRILEAFGDVLQHPQSIGQVLGAQLADAADDPAKANAVRVALMAAAITSEAEHEALWAVLRAQPETRSSRRLHDSGDVQKVRIEIAGKTPQRIEAALSSRRIVITGKNLTGVQREALERFLRDSLQVI